MDIPSELVEQFARGNGVILVGAGLSRGAGLPGWDALLEPLADRISLPSHLRVDPLKVAQHYENQRNRQALLQHIVEQTDTTGTGPTENHHRLLHLGAHTWVTTNYDNLIERTFQQADMRFTKMVRDQDLPYASADMVTLIKLHGDREQPDTIVITQQDYHTYFRRFPRVKDKLTGLLLEKTFLFVGYSVNDPDFNQIQAEIAFDLQHHQRMAYAVLLSADEFTLSDLRSRNICALNVPLEEHTDYSQRLGELLDKLIRQIDQAREQRIQAVGSTAATLAPTPTEDVRGLLEAMGYRITDTKTIGSDLYFLCEAKWGAEIRQEVVHFVGTEPTASAIAALNDSVISHSAARGILLTREPLPDPLCDLAHQREHVQCYTLDEFIDRLADFRPYLEQLIKEYEVSEIPAFYVPLAVESEADDDQASQVFKPLASFVDAWLNESGRNHLSILGDFGSGKTWFCQRYSYLAARRYLSDPAHNRIPILITLRDYSRAYDIEQLVTDAIANRYKVGLAAGYKTFARLNEAGRLLLIFDGFDEMERRVSDYRTTVDNFWELAKAVCPNSKVLLTCRTAYFRHRGEEEETLTPRHRRVSVVAGDRVIDLRGQDQFEVAYLLDFGDEDIQSALQKRLPADWKLVYQRLQELSNLRDLASRPVLLDMIVKTLPQIQGASQINQASLYEAYVDALLERRWSEDTDYIVPQERLFFMQELAWEMYQTQRLIIPFSEFPERVTEYFGLRDDPEQSAFFERDVRTQSYLIRDDVGNYRFAHKSFMEYFVARKMASALSNQEHDKEQTVDVWKTNPLTPEVRDFLAFMLINPAPLWQLIEETRGQAMSQIGYAGGNATRVLSTMGNPRFYVQSDFDFSRTILTGADFTGKILTNANFEDTVLASADMTAADLSAANLQRANLRGARLTFARLIDADMRFANLSDVNLREFDQVRDIAFSPDKEAIAIVAANQIRLMHLDTGDILASAIHPTYFRCVVFHPDGRHLIAGAADGVIRVWNVDPFLEVSSIRPVDSVYSLSFAPNGEELFVGGDRGQCVALDYESMINYPNESMPMNLMCSVQGKIRASLYSSEGKYLVIGGQRSSQIEVLERTSGQIVKRLLLPGSSVMSLALCSDSGNLACGGSNGYIYVFDFATGSLVAKWLVEERADRWIWDVRYTSNGHRLISDGPHCTVAIWDTHTGKVTTLLSGHTGRLSAVAVSPDGTRIASGGIDGTARIWDISIGSQLRVFEQKLDCRGLRIQGIQTNNESLITFLIERGATED